jgi:hypothetical protein
MTDPSIKQQYVEYFFNARRDVVELETIEVYHPAFSRRYHLVRNGGAGGATVTLETGVVVHFEYVPFKVRQLASRADLDFGIGIDLGDLGEIVPAELDRVKAADQMHIPAQVIYRTYRGDNLSAPMYGPVTLEAAEIPRSPDGATLNAGVPAMNISGTGEIYDYETFPGLRNLQ